MDNTGPGQSPDAFIQQFINEGLLDEEQAKEIDQKAHAENIPLIIYIEQQGILKAHDVAAIASRYYSLSLYDLSTHDTELIPEEFLSLDIVKKHYGLPIQLKDNKLIIAIADPNTAELEEVPFLTGLPAEYVLVEADKLRDLIEEYVKETKFATEIEAIDEEFDDFEISAYEDEPEVVTSYDINDTPVVRYVNKILIDGIKSKSSDIHFEPYESYYRIRYRQDGILREVSNPPLQLANSLVARIKVLANLDISEHRVLQDGRFKMTLSSEHAIDFRISTLPTLNGEKVAHRFYRI